MAHSQMPETGSPEMTLEDFILFEQTRIESTLASEAHFDNLKEMNSKRNNLSDTSEKSDPKQEINQSSQISITHDSEIHTPCRHGISGTNVQAISNFFEEGALYYIPYVDITTATISETESDNYRLIAINPEMMIMEESISHNPAMQILDFSGSKNISIIAQNTASNLTVSQNCNLPVEISETVESKGNNIIFVNDIHSVPGSSSSNENMPQSNLCLEVFQSMTSLNLQTILELQKKTSDCLVCQREMTKHVHVFEGNILYSCCQCGYKWDKKDVLFMHIYNHIIEPFYCSYCNVIYSEKGLHGILEACNLCKENFQCKAQLEYHYKIHESYLLEYCRICTIKIDEHTNEVNSEIFFQCCECSFRNDQFYLLRKHLYIHSNLKLFKCDQCGKRYTEKRSLSSHSKIHQKCKKCEEVFPGKNALDEHYFKEHWYSLV